MDDRPLVLAEAQLEGEKPNLTLVGKAIGRFPFEKAIAPRMNR